ncbi:MAG: 50S ribosomal protein L9, partial [Candidatus Magasanikbacteria bacterium RIFCSPLOWO2_12_FULL_34_7]
FLLKKGLAKLATDESLESLKNTEIKIKKESEKELKDNQKKASILDGEHIDMTAKVNDKGVLYAAISANEICKILKKEFKVDIVPDQIMISKPIKELGEHTVIIEFGHGLEAELNITVSED